MSLAEARGKHRIAAELNHLEQEFRILQEELEKMERMEKVSTLCQELLNNVESRPDPLLPKTNGPVEPSWDQWFEGPKNIQRCICRIL